MNAKISKRTMRMRAYVFVDAENHFLRSIAAAREVIGFDSAARALALAELEVPGVGGFPDRIEGKRFAWNPELQLFWDCEVLSMGGASFPQTCLSINRATYVCSCTGGHEKAHEARVALRGFGFDPAVIQEPKDLRDQRDNVRDTLGLIEKPKGCDIALATRMVADAAADLYDWCLLFTSDADFIPAIEAIRAMGKVVYVFGFKRALGKKSGYLHVPDNFIDLERSLKTVWHNKHAQICGALKALGEKGPFPSPSPT